MDMRLKRRIQAWAAIVFGSCPKSSHGLSPRGLKQRNRSRIPSTGKTDREQGGTP